MQSTTWWFATSRNGPQAFSLKTLVLSTLGPPVQQRAFIDILWNTSPPVSENGRQSINTWNSLTTLISVTQFLLSWWGERYTFILKETCLGILLVKRQMKNLSYCKKRIHFQAKWACCGLIKSFWREVRVSSSCHLSPSRILDLLMLTMYLASITNVNKCNSTTL